MTQQEQDELQELFVLISRSNYNKSAMMEQMRKLLILLAKIRLKK